LARSSSFFGAGEDDIVFNVALHLPDIAGMGFENVDGQEADFAVVVVVKLVEGGNLPPEGRSSVAAEDEDNGLPGGKLGELDALAFVEFEQREVGGRVARAEFASAGVGPEGFKGQAQEYHGGGHARHDAAEGFRGLAHRPDDVAGEDGVEHDHSDEAAREPEFHGAGAGEDARRSTDIGRTDPHWAEMVQD